MSLVPATAARTSVTPNARMTTIASPTVGGATEQSVWWVDMDPGQAGPAHVVDVEQVWTVLGGTLLVEVDETLTAHVGDTLVLPAGAVRRVHAPDGARALVCSRAGAKVSVPGETAGRGTPEWMQ